MSSTASPDSARSAGLMDRIYRHQRHVYDITRKYHLLGRDEDLELLDALVMRGRAVGDVARELRVSARTVYNRRIAVTARLGELALT